MPQTTYTPIASVTLSSSASEVVFSGLPQTYRDLILVANPVATSTVDNMLFRVNGDTASNYSYVYMRGNGSTTNSGSATTSYIIADLLPNGVETTLEANYVIQFFDYSATDKHKTMLGRYNDASQGVGAVASRWASTTAINSIRFYISGASFASGSTFNLFGVIA